MRKGRDHRRPQIEIHLPKYLSKNIQKHTHTKKLDRHRFDTQN